MTQLLQTLDRVATFLSAPSGDFSIPRNHFTYFPDLNRGPLPGEHVFRFEISNRRHETEMHVRNVKLGGSDAHADSFDCVLLAFNDLEPPRMTMGVDRLYFCRLIFKGAMKNAAGETPEAIDWQECSAIIRAQFKPKLSSPASSSFDHQRLEVFACFMAPYSEPLEPAAACNMRWAGLHDGVSQMGAA